jgi:UDP-N-acetylglucosamine 4,6-dehydratase
MNIQKPKSLHRSFRGNFQQFDGKSVLITGGTGSFGSRFVRRVLDHSNPTRLIVFSRDELKQFDMTNSLANHPKFKCLRFFIGDVRDQSRLELALREVDYVVHAAAMKQVATAEYNPFECIHTNILGAENVVRAALRCGVKHVVALSTDKAASPANLYGASKLAADKIFVAANRLVGNQHIKFSVVRYGNVLGSRGSVVPFFRRMIDQGAKDLPITDEKMTRFWITLDQGIDFVVSSFEVMQGGEIFIPKIPSMKIVDLASTLAPHLPHRIVGARPGEKIHEVMITEDDARLTIDLADRYVICPPNDLWTDVPYRERGGHYAALNFRYGSDNNSEWLDGPALQSLLSAGDYV